MKTSSWVVNFLVDIKCWTIKHVAVINQAIRVVGVLSAMTILGIVASQSPKFKMECPDSLFYYIECFDFWWLDLMICAAVGLSTIICLMQIYVFDATPKDVYIGFVLLIANAVVAILLAIATTNDILHIGDVYKGATVPMFFNLWHGLAVTFSD